MNKHGLYDIYEVWHIPFWQTNIFYLVCKVIAILLCFIVVGCILIRLKKVRKKNIPEWEIALIELQQLEQNNTIHSKSSKLFYSRMTQILKSYLESRYNLSLQGKTDQEMLLLLHDSDFPKELLKDLETVISGAIETKFAQGHALEKQIIEHINMSKALVKSTIPKRT